MKTFRIILINLIALILIFILSEYITRCIHYKTVDFHETNKNLYSTVWIDNEDKRFDNSFFLNDGNEKFTFRKSIIKDTDNYDSIILAGCSYTFGYNLEYKDTFPVVLSEYNKNKNIYNLGLDGASPREFLYILRNKNILSKIINPMPKKGIEYVIYTYMSDQDERLYGNIYRKSPSFIRIKDKLIYYKSNPILLHSLLFYKISKYISYEIIPDKMKNKLLNIYFKEIYKEIKKNFGEKTNFIIFVYDYNPNIDFNELEKQGIQIIYSYDILHGIDFHKPEYTTIEGYHPNRKAWETIVPVLIKNLDKKVL